MSDKLREIAMKVDALARRMDACSSRADAETKSGTMSLSMSTLFEVPMPVGEMEVEWTVPLKYSLELGEPANIKVSGHPDINVPLSRSGLSAEEQAKIRATADREVKKNMRRKLGELIGAFRDIL